MLRHDPSRIDPDSNGQFPESPTDEPGFTYGEAERTGSIDIQRELDRLEEMIIDSRHIPFTAIALVSEGKFLDQLDLVRVSLPEAVREAEEIVHHKEDILLQAEDYAEQIIEAAHERANQILDEMGLIRRAEQQAAEILAQVQEDCLALQEQTLSEIDQMRQAAQQELEQMRQQAIAEATEIQNGADDYADQVLDTMEQKLNEMLRVIRNGRQQLNGDQPSGKK